MTNPKLSSGKRAPAFTLFDGFGKRFRLTEQRGRWGVVFFYPKNKTVGARNMVQSFQEHVSAFEENDAFLLGVSSDEFNGHAEFASAENLSFPLLVDRSNRVASKYGAWRKRKTNGRSYFGTVRCTFLVDPSGRIAHVWDNVRIPKHAERVLRTFLSEVEVD